jgi:hypothetical protein
VKEAQETIAKQIDERWRALPGVELTWTRAELGLDEVGLAATAGVPYDKAFRQRLWAAREAFRLRTGRQIVLVEGRLVVLSAEEQAKYAMRARRKARIKARRAVDIAARVPLDELPEGEREAHARRTDKMAHLLALEEVASRRRDVLAGMGRGAADEIRARADEARSRTAAWERLFKS